MTRKATRLFNQLEIKQCFVLLNKITFSDEIRFLGDSAGKVQSLENGTSKSAKEPSDADDFGINSDVLGPVESAQSIESIHICNDFDPFK